VNSVGRKSPTNLGNTAPFSDDDGGYLRLKVRAYYTAGAMPLPGSAAPPTPTPTPTPAPAPDFALALTPAQLVIARGTTGTFTITLTTQGGFAAPVSLSSTSAPSLNANRTLGTKQLSAPGSTTLRISVSRTATRRTYTITLKGVGGGLTRTATATVVVK
jgi:hypothetical protein